MKKLIPVNIYHHKKQLDETLKKSLHILEQFKQNDERRGDFYISIGWLYDQLALKSLGKRLSLQSKAIQFFKKAIRSKDKEVKFQGLRGLATVFLHQNELRTALNFYKKAYALKNNFHIYNDLGNVYQKLGEYSKASNLYKKALVNIENKQGGAMAAIPLFNLIKLNEKMNKISDNKKYLKLLKKISKNSQFARQLLKNLKFKKF